METCVDDVAGYLTSTANIDFARKSSLFYKANVNYLVSTERELIRAHPDDALGFVPRSPRDLSIGKGIVGSILQSHHEIQIHVHHEYYTYNDTARDPETYAYLQTPRGRAFDNARLELALRLSLGTLREDGGLDLGRWFFIHGHWALNASDPHECTIVREIEILRRNGCLGDFTQPAGRIHVDSRIDVPYLVDPVAAPKGYDSAAANPTEAAGVGEAARERFLIWASATTHKTCSIDTFSPLVQRRLNTPGLAALDHARSGVVVDGVLYVKTHCHSMHPLYFKPDGPSAPHTDAGVRAELGGLFDAAAKAGADVRFLSASEAYEEIISAARPPARDLAKVYGLESESPMAAIGMTVTFRTSAGGPASAPPLGERAPFLPSQSLVAVREQGPSAPKGSVIAHVAQIAADGTTAVVEVGGNRGALIDATAVAENVMAANDVRQINGIASAVALKRLEELGAEESGLTGFYAGRAQQRQLLQLSEVLCAEFIHERLPNAKGAYEIGCGLGLLSLLLAKRGQAATGFERNGTRLETGKAIAKAYLASVGGAFTPPDWSRGHFLG